MNKTLDIVFAIVYYYIDIKISKGGDYMMDNNSGSISLATYNRMPKYLKALCAMRDKGELNVSSVALADYVGDNASVVKKDLSYAIKSEGKPKIGYDINNLITDIEEFLGYNNTKEAVLVGVGKLGQALLGYGGFENYGLKILAGFDIDDKIIGKEINGREILPTGKLASVIEKLNIKMAILTTPKEHAQVMADLMIKSGVRAIWNFTPCHLEIPCTVAVRNEDMAASLAILSKELKEILTKES
jgi:redox-sensing transcriptional repressor